MAGEGAVETFVVIENGSGPVKEPVEAPNSLRYQSNKKNTPELSRNRVKICSIIY